jgi:hypothetical protein
MAGTAKKLRRGGPVRARAQAGGARASAAGPRRTVKVCGGAVGEAPRSVLRLRRGREHLVEDVEVAFAFGLVDEPRLFEQVRVDAPALEEGRRPRKVELDELAKARRVVVTLRLGVAERLEDRVRLHDARAEAARRRSLAPVHASAPHEVAHQYLGRLSLACAALARDDDGLALLGALERPDRPVGGLGDRVRVRRDGRHRGGIAYRCHRWRLRGAKRVDRNEDVRDASAPVALSGACVQVVKDVRLFLIPQSCARKRRAPSANEDPKARGFVRSRSHVMSLSNEGFRRSISFGSPVAEAVTQTSSLSGTHIIVSCVEASAVGSALPVSTKVTRCSSCDALFVVPTTLNPCTEAVSSWRSVWPESELGKKAPLPMSRRRGRQGGAQARRSSALHGCGRSFRPNERT